MRIEQLQQLIKVTELGSLNEAAKELYISRSSLSSSIKQLEEELLKLRIENAYLKELRRLRLEEEALLKEKRESSTVSEENSN